jgi:hypothetical protein
MDFYKDGETLISANDDGIVQLYNTFEARYRDICLTFYLLLLISEFEMIFLLACFSITRKLQCKDYGVDLIRFTHHQNAVICASNKTYRGTFRQTFVSLSKFLF